MKAQTTFTIEKDLMEKFRIISDKKCTSMSALVEVFIKHYVVNDGNIELNFTKKNR